MAEAGALEAGDAGLKELLLSRTEQELESGKLRHPGKRLANDSARLIAQSITTFMVPCMLMSTQITLFQYFQLGGRGFFSAANSQFLAVSIIRDITRHQLPLGPADCASLLLPLLVQCLTEAAFTRAILTAAEDYSDSDPDEETSFDAPTPAIFSFLLAACRCVGTALAYTSALALLVYSVTAAAWLLPLSLLLPALQARISGYDTLFNEALVLGSDIWLSSLTLLAFPVSVDTVNWGFIALRRSLQLSELPYLHVTSFCISASFGFCHLLLSSTLACKLASLHQTSANPGPDLLTWASAVMLAALSWLLSLLWHLIRTGLYLRCRACQHYATPKPVTG